MIYVLTKLRVYGDKSDSVRQYTEYAQKDNTNILISSKEKSFYVSQLGLVY